MFDNVNCNIADKYDVLVCGGGPAGIGAAAAASFNGAKTLLLESCYYLGGMTGAFVSTWCDSPLCPVAKTLLKDLQSAGAVEIKRNPERYHGEGRYVIESELLKTAEVKKLRQLGCDILFGTTAESVYLKNGEVKGVYAANKNGRTLFTSKSVIDATADGQLAVNAGAKFMQGEPHDGRVQHANFRMKLENCPQHTSGMNLDAIFKRGRKAGQITVPPGCFQPSPDNFPLINDKLISLCNWEIEGVDCSDAEQVSNTLIECHIAAFNLVRFCRKNIPGYENIQISSLPALLGTRESRRIKGKYILSKDDVIQGRKFKDGVAKASFWCDFHDSPPGTTLPYSLDYVKKHRPKNGDWYEIPYRCLVPEGTKNILTAGRCISADRWALASMRVQPACMFTGTAAGFAASECLRQKISVSSENVNGAALKEKIFKLEIP